MVRVNPELSVLRQEIDEIDEQIIALLSLRGNKVLEITKLRVDLRLPVVDSGRDREIIDHVKVVNNGPIPKEDLEGLFEEIIGISRTMQEACVQRIAGGNQ